MFKANQQCVVSDRPVSLVELSLGGQLRWPDGTCVLCRAYAHPAQYVCCMCERHGLHAFDRELCSGRE